MNVKDIFDNYKSVSLDKLSASLKADTPVIVYGAGNLGKKIADCLVKHSYNVQRIADNSVQKWNTTLSGVLIESPQEVLKNFKDNAIWVVSIWSPGHSFKVTKEELASKGVANIYHAVSLMQLFPADFLPHFHFQSPEYFLEHRNEIEQVYDLLEDEESKRQYAAQVNCRVNSDFESLPVADTKNQYFPKDVIVLNTNEVFLDAGAYDGDTLMEFIKRTNNQFQKYLALEPDPVNYDRLLKNAENFPTSSIEVFPYAVGDENGELKFNATGGEGAGFDESGALVVQCRKIDDYFFKYKPTYLKFDIEGAEQPALKGAENTIRTYKPKIAVCLYHLPDDIWTIPLLLKQYNNQYKFFVRTHSLDGFEFVLYAITE